MRPCRANVWSTTPFMPLDDRRYPPSSVPAAPFVVMQGGGTRLASESDGDDPHAGAVYERHAAALEAYVAAQGACDLRGAPFPSPPWPGRSNPMIEYLVDRAVEMSSEAPMEAVLAWLSWHAWFEGSIEGRLAERRAAH